MVKRMSESRIESVKRMSEENQAQFQNVSEVLKSKQAQARAQKDVDVSINTLIQTTQVMVEQSAKMARMASSIQEQHESDQANLFKRHEQLVISGKNQNIRFNNELIKLNQAVENSVQLTSTALKDEILPDIKHQIEGFEITVSERLERAYAKLDRCRRDVLNQSNFFSNFLDWKNIVLVSIMMSLYGTSIFSAGINYYYAEYSDMAWYLLVSAGCIGFYFVLYRLFFVDRFY
jgi:hypothetical protein